MDLFTRKQQIKRFDPVKMTTGNILSEAQILFVLREIEKLRAVDEQGTKEEVLMDVILPEFIVFVFCKKFSLTVDEASEALKIQEEFLELNYEVSAPLAASSPLTTGSLQKQAAKRGRPKKVPLATQALDTLATPTTSRKRKQENDVALQVPTASKVCRLFTRQLRKRSYVGRC